MNSHFIINLLLLHLLCSCPEEERGSLVEHGTVPKFADLPLSKRRPRSHLLTTGIKIQYHSRISNLSILASGLCLGRHTKRDLGTITLSLAEDGIVPDADEGFEETLRLARSARAQNRLHGQFGETIADTFLPGLQFAEANVRELGIDEEA